MVRCALLVGMCLVIDVRWSMIVVCSVVVVGCCVLSVVRCLLLGVWRVMFAFACCVLDAGL